MPDQRFGPLISFSDVERDLLDHLKLWLPIWLPARERHFGLDVGTIARPRSWVSKSRFTALPGEERTPIVIAVCGGLAQEPRRSGTGIWDAVVRVGIGAMCMAHPEGASRVLCGHYQSALMGICLKHKTTTTSRFHDFVGLTIDDLDEEATGRHACAFSMEFWYKVPNFVEDLNPPIMPSDPIEPGPDDPVIETVQTEVEVL